MKKITKIFTSLALASVLASGLYAANVQNSEKAEIKQAKQDREFCDMKQGSKNFKKDGRHHNFKNPHNAKKGGVYQELELTNEQKDKIKEIQDESRKTTEDKIYKILDENQKKKFDENKKERSKNLEERAKMLKEKAQELEKRAK